MMSVARGAAHDDEPPGTQPPVIRRAHGALEDQLQRTGIGSGLEESLR
jgi:hypothetical protein